MKTQIVIGVLFSLLLSSCGDAFLRDNAEVRFERDVETIKQYAADNNITLTEDPATGVFYNKTKENPEGRESDLSYLQHLAYDLRVLEGMAIDAKVAEDSAIFNYYNSSVIPGFVAATLILKEGEAGTFYIPSPLAYGQNSPGELPEWAIMELELEAVAFFSEEDRIEDYIESNSIELATVTADSIRIVLRESLPGVEKVKDGDAVEVKYTGKLLDNEEFDSGTLNFVVGSGNLIAGFDTGIKAFGVGEKGTIIFPSSKGYGSRGSGSILPFSPLVFDVEVLKVNE